MFDGIVAMKSKFCVIMYHARRPINSGAYVLFPQEITYEPDSEKWKGMKQNKK